MMDLDAESRRILELARAARTPSDVDKARVERRFAMALGLSAAAASVAPAAHAAQGASAVKAATGMAALKWWLGGSALLAAAVAGYLSASARSPQTAAPVSSARAVATTSAPRAAEPIAEPESVPAQPTVMPTPAEPGHEPALRHFEHHRRNPRGDSLAAELDLLHRAQAAWRAREAGSALLLLDEHRARYPRSALGLERDALQVLTLCELARKDDAARLARSVLTRAPRSPLRASLEQSCALK
jgi:hypothetical protein